MSKTVLLEMWALCYMQSVVWEGIAMQICFPLQMINPLYTAPERQIDNPLYEAGGNEQ